MHVPLPIGRSAPRASTSSQPGGYLPPTAWLDSRGAVLLPRRSALAPLLLGAFVAGLLPLAACAPATPSGGVSTAPSISVPNVEIDSEQQSSIPVFEPDASDMTEGAFLDRLEADQENLPEGTTMSLADQEDTFDDSLGLAFLVSVGLASTIGIGSALLRRRTARPQRLRPTYFSSAPTTRRRTTGAHRVLVASAALQPQHRTRQDQRARSVQLMRPHIPRPTVPN